MRGEVLQANWIHTPRTEKWLEKMAIGKTLNVCCGTSGIGEVRVDIADGTNFNLKADVHMMPFKRQTFDTVICDPPFSYYNKFKWITRLGDIARRRLLLSTGHNTVKFDRDIWDTRLYYDDSAMFLRLWWCFDRKVSPLE